MELHTPTHYRHMAQEKHQMLDLNHRLQSYLGRVKLLEEDNTMLAQEIQTLRHGHHGASAREKSLKEDLHRARAELDQVWRERVYAQMDVCKLSEEIQMVEHHWQKEARAQAEVKAKMEVSRKELEEEHGAQRWLRERINQMEEEMEHLVRNHEADVARLETALSHSAPPRSTPNLDLLQLEQELSQRASRAWQETAEAYQAQLDQMEGSLRESAARLGQTERHKNEYQAQLTALEREAISEGEVRRQMEETAEQQREEHRQHMNTLQEHWEGLEKEKQHLGQQLDRLAQENRGLLQQKMSLGLEVVTYRALLDGESLRRDDVALVKESRSITLKDTPVKPLRGNYQLPVRCNTFTSVWRPPTTSTTPLRSKPVTVSQARKDEETTTTVAKQGSPYPKILHNGAVEKFRAQEVDEKVTYAEPLSSPGEGEHEEHPAESVQEEYGGKSEDEASVGFQLQSGSPKGEGLSSRIIEEKKEISHRQSSTQEPKSELLRMTEKTLSSSAQCNQEQQPSFPVEEKAVNGFQLQSGGLPLTTEITEYQSSTKEFTSDLLGVTEETFSSTAVSNQKQSPCVLLEEKATVGFELQSEAPLLTKEISQHQTSTQELSLDILGMTEETISSSATCKQEQPPCVPMEEKTAGGLQLQAGAQPLTKDIIQHQSSTHKPKTELLAVTEEIFSSSAIAAVEACMVEDEQEQTSSSGKEVLEPTLDYRTSSPSSQTELNPVDVSEIRQEIRYSTLGTTATEAVDKLYPDGEEMDTWDSVIEKKIHVESSKHEREAERQYAEPEEDISTRRSEPSREEMKKQYDEIWLQHEEQSPYSGDKDVNEEDEDSQNVSVSWRTELESDSYAQENTLADTRPLIRYNSDETDANTQATHVDESESSDGEQDRKSGEASESAWNESKAKNFGTMEDLCEEVDDYDLEYSQKASGLEKPTLKVGEDHLVEDIPADVDDVELETDRLVEQEFENLSTDSYASHFAEEVTNERQAIVPEDEEEVHGKMIMKQVITESDIQVTHSLDLRDSMQPQRWQEVEEEEVQDRMMTEEQESMPESDVQLGSKMEIRDSEQPQTLEEVEEVEVQDGMMKMGEDIIKETELKVEHDFLGESVQPQLDSPKDDVKEKVEEWEVQDRIMTMVQEFVMESDVQVEPNQDIRDLVPPQVNTIDNEEKVQDKIMTMEHEEAGKGNLPSCMDPDVQVEDDLDLEESILPQLDTPDDEESKEIEEKEVEDEIFKQEESQKVHLLSCTDSDVKGESNLDIVPPQSLSDGEKIQVEIMTMEQEEADKVKSPSYMDPDVQVEGNLDLRDFVLPQLDSTDDYVEEVQDEILKQEEAQKVHLMSSTHSDVHVESTLDLIPPESESPGNGEKLKVETTTMEQEEADKAKSASYMDPNVQVESNLDLVPPESDYPCDGEKVQDEIMTMEQAEADKVNSPSGMDPDVQVEGNLDLSDFVPPQLDSPDGNVEEVPDDILKQEEAQKVYLLSCTDADVQMESIHDLVPTESESPGDGENVHVEIMTMEQEEADKVKSPSYMDPDVQIEGNLDLRDFIAPQLDSPHDDVEVVQDEILKQEAQETYLLSCTDSDVQMESNLDLVPTESESPRDGEKVKVEIMTMEQEEAHTVNSPSYMDPDVQVEGNLDFSDFVPPQLDSPDDYVEEVQDEILKQGAQNLLQPQLDSRDDEEKVQDEIMTIEQEANKVNVPSCMDPGVQEEDNLDLRDFVQPQVDFLDDHFKEVQDVTLKQDDDIMTNLPVCIYPDDDKVRQGVQDSLEAPERREDEFEFNVSMVTHADETFSEFFHRPDLGEEDEEELLEKPKCESQNQKSVLQKYTSSMVEDPAGHLADEWNILENTSEVVDIRHPKDEEESVVSHLHEEVGDGEGAATFGEKPGDISPKTATEESVIFAVKDSSSEFYKSNDTGKRNLWAAHSADKWNVPENASKDVDIRHPKDEESVVTHLHEEADDGDGAPTFNEKPVAISPEPAPKEHIFAEDTLSEFHKTNGKDKRDFWKSSLEVAAAYGSDELSTVMSGIRDVEFGGELDWGKTVYESSAHGCAPKKDEQVTEVSLHSEESEVEGGSWSSGDE